MKVELVFLILVSAPSIAASQDELTLRAMEEDLDQLMRNVASDWGYTDDKKEHFGVNLQGLREGAVAKLKASMTRSEFAVVLEEVVASLKDGHAAVMIPGIKQPFYRLAPFSLRDTRDGILIDEIEETFAKNTGMARGDEVCEIDERPVDKEVARFAARISASTDLARRTKAIDRLALLPEDDVNLTIRRPGREPWRVTIRKDAPILSRKASKFLDSRIIGDIGYLRISTFQPVPDAWSKAKIEDRDKVLAGAKEEVRKAFEELAGRKTLILDVRGNEGGTDLLGMYVAQHLLPPSFAYFTLQGRILKPDGQKGGWAPRSPYSPPQDSSIKRYPGRLVVLLDERCFSTTDNFLACLKDLHPTVRFVGRPSEGGTGAPGTIATLPHSSAVVIACTMRVWSPKGTLIEGRGTRPDIEVQWTREDILSRKDPDLEAAVKEAQGK